MSGTCLAVGAAAMMLAAPTFTLSWTHSVERVSWSEAWTVSDAGLSLRQAAVKGSGAGMEPGPGARLRDGWWVWPGDVAVPRLVLAASGATGAGWTLCSGGHCTVLGHTAGAPLVLAPCAVSSR